MNYILLHEGLLNENCVLLRLNCDLCDSRIEDGG